MRSEVEGRAGGGARTNARYLRHRIAALDVVHHPLLLRGRRRRWCIFSRRAARMVRAAGGPAGYSHGICVGVLGRGTFRAVPDARPGTVAPLLAHAVPVGQLPTSDVQELLPDLVRRVGAAAV